MFDPVDPRQSFPELERGILHYWREEEIFKRSLRSLVALDTEEAREGEMETQYSFYDGPPFATGLPHYGHLLAGTIKDAIPRYQTMRGKHVQRRFGWDCHGLPVEYEVEKEFGLDRDKIRQLGVAAFNDLCRSIVLRYTGEWRKTVERTGRWVDMDWDYRTMDPEYMESIWWVFKRLFNQGLIKEGHKPMHICPRCGTPLSNFEVTQGYAELTDLSVTAKFEVKEVMKVRKDDTVKVFLLAWTTTPWTLPGNVLLAIHPAIEYARFRSKLETGASIGVKGREFRIEPNEEYIAAKSYFEFLPVELRDSLEHIEDIKGSDLLDLHYLPDFPYFADRYAENGFRVVEADFVSTEEGTGIVHIAPGFGEEDFNLGKREGLPLLQHVTPEGTFTKEVTDFAGLPVKPKDDPAKTDRLIAKYLEENGLLFEPKIYTHSYPLCWRCDTPLLNYATSSWFVDVSQVKASMIQNIQTTTWVPAHLRDGRFGNWLSNAREWAISRNRFWGTPLPLWRQEDTGELTCIGSREELAAKVPDRFTRITVLRHGESQGNLIPVYQGEEPGTDLTDRGQAQAARAATYLRQNAVHRVYTSPLLRARRTAEEIARQTGAEVTVDDRLREVRFGEYEGKPMDLTDRAFAQARRAHKLGQHDSVSPYHFPGMETWVEVAERVQSFLKEVLEKHRGEHVVVVTHSDPLRNFKHAFTKEEPEKLLRQPLPSYAEPHLFLWDHRAGGPFDLHKEYADDITWQDGKPEDAVTLTVMRHPETDWNAADRVCGQADRPLTDAGRSQVQALLTELRPGDYDAIVSSDLIRAKETAATLADAWGKSLVTDPLFREQDVGSLEGKRQAELDAEDPEYMARFREAIVDAPGGETRDQLLKRAQEALRWLRERYQGKRVLLITHARFLTAVKILEQGDQPYRSPENSYRETLSILPRYRRVPEVLDCWFESGSMPYAQMHFPFSPVYAPADRAEPHGFPADFIAEGVDQTRGWFYTLTVLAAALFDKPAFKHVVVNGTVLAEDGRKMSKRLKNFPDPLEVIERHGADALRFTLLGSPAVRAEDMRFSERLSEETVRSLLLPFWNAHAFFTTYANLAGWQPDAGKRPSAHPLDRWILAEVQQLTNRLTDQLDAYNLSGSCALLTDAVDGLTNWYVRLSRRRFAGRSEGTEMSSTADDQHDALQTLHQVLITFSQLLAPFCPFLAEAVYLNLSGDDHGSVHLTRWPQSRALTPEEQELLDRTRLLRTAVSLGLKIRSEKKVKVRQPLARATVALPKSARQLGSEDLQLLQEELNVKQVAVTHDATDIAEAFVRVDARAVGPRLGAKVQQVILAGKRGEFEELQDGSIKILDETFTPQEAVLSYRGREGQDVAASRGMVVSLDTTVTPELKREGQARDLIRFIQQQRKDAGLSVKDRISLQILGATEVLQTYGPLIAQETGAELGPSKGEPKEIELDGERVEVRFGKQ